MAILYRIAGIHLLPLTAPGCGLIPIPYFVSDVRGPILGVQAVDADTGRDIPETKVALHSVVVSGDLGAMTAPSGIAYSTPDHKDGEIFVSDGVACEPDGIFRLNKKPEIGLRNHFGQLSPLGWAANCRPISCIEVDAPGYDRIVYMYCHDSHLKPGSSNPVTRIRSDAAKSDGEKPLDASREAPLYVCQLDEAGILTFYFYRNPPASRERIREKENLIASRPSR